MMQARISKDKAAPWWAAILAPLVGVPLMVGLLALSAPKKAATEAETDTGMAKERVEAENVDYSADRLPERVGQPLESCVSV